APIQVRQSMCCHMQSLGRSLVVGVWGVRLDACLSSHGRNVMDQQLADRRSRAKNGSALLMCVVVAWWFGVPLAASSAPRRWVPQDSLSVRYVSLHPYSPTAWFLGERAQPQAVTPSPDGKYFFFLTYRGEMASDSTVVELHVYSVEQIRSWLRVVEAERTAAPEPYRRVALRSHSSSESEPAIRGVQWEPNGKGILFAGMTAEGLMQIHRLDVSSGRLDQLTFRPDGVAEFHARGESLLFKSEVAKRTPDERS